MAYPRLLPLLLLSAVLAAASAPARGGAPCAQGFAELGDGFTGAREAFKRLHDSFDLISGKDNRAFKKLLGSRHGEDITVLDAENAILKELNDTLFPEDKDLVTAFVNQFKSELHSRVLADPYLNARIAARYQDHKSIRFVFEGSDPGLKERIGEAYLGATRAFAATTEKLGLKSRIDQGHGLSAHAATWHLAGISSTLEEASAAARHARAFGTGGTRPGGGGANEIPLQTFAQAKATLDAKLSQVEQLRLNLQRTLGTSNLMKPLPYSPARKTLSENAIEAIRKTTVPSGSTTEEYLDAIRAVLKGRFATEVTREQADWLKEYLRASDAFMAGLLVEERVIIPVSQGKYDVISVDFRGQNSRNIHETLVGLAETSAVGGDSRMALGRSRAAEERATRVLDELKDRFRSTLQGLFGNSARDSTYFSGDDGAHLAARPLGPADRRLPLWNLYRGGEADDFRMVFLTRGSAPPEDRMRWIVAGEKIEKKLRDHLSDLFTQEPISKLMFASEIMPLGDGPRGRKRMGLRFKLVGKPSPAVRMALLRKLEKLATEYQFELQDVETLSPDQMPAWYSPR